MTGGRGGGGEGGLGQASTCSLVSSALNGQMCRLARYIDRRSAWTNKAHGHKERCAHEKARNGVVGRRTSSQVGRPAYALQGHGGRQASKQASEQQITPVKRKLKAQLKQ